MSIPILLVFYLAGGIAYLIWRFDKLVAYSFYAAPRKSQAWLVFVFSLAVILVLWPIFLLMNYRKPLS